ncbi:MAG: thioredoxin-dependent thiol peroxidase [Bacteroidetes bacterium]|nr:MAG: thioredoxin-dependent thiol peroxidase [Bacteroidota bacterium]PIE87554.1 MAG: thioredoxin-dependent thiol peroxidase [Bacteroidota bacterium]
MALLKPGDKAPEFVAKDQHGNVLSLRDFAGSKLIFYFYPKDNTPGCTAEACNLRDNYQRLLDKGFKIVGVSKDSEKSHVNFTNKYELPFPLIPDTSLEVIKRYGVWGPKKMAGREYEGIYRTTYVIDENGVVEKVFSKVKTKDHTEQILAEY